MAKFYDKVGYGVTEDTGDGVWVESITERSYYGDVLKLSRRWENSENLNDNLNVSHQISIVADAYAYEHFSAIRYVCWMGARWKVTDVTVQRPRLILSIGGVYNGPEV